MKNPPENIKNKDVFVNSIADHDMIACSRETSNICYNPKTNYSLKELKSDIAKIDQPPVYDNKCNKKIQKVKLNHHKKCAQ